MFVIRSFDIRLATHNSNRARCWREFAIEKCVVFVTGYSNRMDIAHFANDMYIYIYIHVDRYIDIYIER